MVTLLPLPAALDAPPGPAQAAHSSTANSAAGSQINDRFIGVNPRA